MKWIPPTSPSSVLRASQLASLSASFSCNSLMFASAAVRAAAAAVEDASAATSAAGTVAAGAAAAVVCASAAAGVVPGFDFAAASSALRDAISASKVLRLACVCNKTR